MAKKKQNKQTKGAVAQLYARVTGWKWFWVVGNLLLAGVIAAVLIFGSQAALDFGTNNGEHLEVPEFVGMRFKDAEALAEKVGVRLEIVDSVFAKTGRGLVREQNPKAGAQVKEGRRIQLTMNALGVQKVSMPNLVGYSARQAVAELSSRGLTLGKFLYVEDMATNNVLQQKYRGRDIEPGTMVEAEARIDIVLGLNPRNSETLIPDVTGKHAPDAVREVNDYYLNIRSLRYDRSVKTYEDSLKAVVYKQEPELSELPVQMGTDVTLYLRVEKAE